LKSFEKFRIGTNSAKQPSNQMQNAQFIFAKENSIFRRFGAANVEIKYSQNSKIREHVFDDFPIMPLHRGKIKIITAISSIF
jgi:hypothetical protein